MGPCLKLPDGNDPFAKTGSGQNVQKSSKCSKHSAVVVSHLQGNKMMWNGVFGALLFINELEYTGADGVFGAIYIYINDRFTKTGSGQT